MLLGITIEPYMLVLGGSALFLLLVFQVLEGTRKIKFKGALHLKVHKVVAYSILAFVIVHATVAVAYLEII
jgi:cytochrome b561